ncbi:hypothetical protein CBS101457_003113 [Exobasidium rhododendri]|nr:hypothetical protein CBS101457_003113 [Exobasidium rhododendri]
MGFLYSQFFVKIAYPSASCEGQTIIVTGSNSGLGKEAARHFARLKVSKLILAVRNTKAGAIAKREIEESTGCGKSVIEVWPLDLSSYDSVKAFASRASSTLPRIDALVENAGISTQKFSLSEGHEQTITVNVISTFLLALLMVPKLKSVAKEFGFKPRLTIVSSEVHGWAKFSEGKEASVFAALDNNSPKNMKDRYMTSKLLEVLVVRHIAPLLQDSNVTLNMLNPGMCHSGLMRDVGFVFSIVVSIIQFILARTTEMGSRTLYHSATAAPDSHGQYMSDGKVDDSAVSAYVKSKGGAETGKRVWTELSKILESIEPGVTGVLESK